MISLPLYRIELCISWIRATLSGPEVVIYCILTLASLCLMYLQPERLSAFHSKSKWGKECSAVEWAAGWGIKSRHYSNYSSHRLWNADVWWCLMYMITTFPCINLRSEWHTRGGLKGCDEELISGVQLSVWLLVYPAPICTSTEDKNHRQWRYNIHRRSNIIWSEKGMRCRAEQANSSHISREIFATVDSEIAFPIIRQNPMSSEWGQRTRIRKHFARSIKL